MFKLTNWLRSLSLSPERAKLNIYLLLATICMATALGGTGAYVYYRTVDTIHQNPDWQCQHASGTDNPVKAENFCPGTDAWRLDHPTGSSSAIEGFTAPVSVNVGEKLKIYVSTTAPTYIFQVYRMGWYQGKGGRLVYSSGTLHGINQPPPIFDPATRMVSCSNWHDPVTLAIPTSWISGVYIVKLLSSVGYMRYTIFVVRNDTSHSPILFQTSVLTYQAYNWWGGYGLYSGRNEKGGYTSENRAYVASFDRPYDGNGLGDFVRYEYNLLRWLEREGYNISYTTDIDTDMRGTLLLQHSLFLAAGHDEYWSTAMRDRVTTARDRGVSLAFFGGNDIYWHVRLHSSPLGADREIVCYRDAKIDPIALTDPREVTVRWSDKPLNNPENALLGEIYGGIADSPASLLLAPGAAPFVTGTKLSVGSSLPGLVGGEYDHIYQNGATPSSLSILASSPLKCNKASSCPSSGTDVANATLYTAASGSKVFDAGTFYWGWGLDDDSFDPKTPLRIYSTPAFQKFTANLLSYLLN
jgi:hypothetical protein